MVDPRRHRFALDAETIALPKGTRVVLKTELTAEDGRRCKAGTVGVVTELAYDSYVVRSAAGRLLHCQRDQLAVQKHDQLPAIARRQADWASLRDRVIYSAVVGSTAWGLADATSDEDLRGVFCLPFEALSGLARPVEEIADPQHDTQYWEVQKLVYLALRADAGALELLWSPHVRVCDDLGQHLRAEREMFISRQVFGTFGRYAISQFSKMRRAEQRVDVAQLVAAALGKGELEEDEAVERVAEALQAAGRAMHTPTEAAREAIRDLYRSLYDRGLLSERGYAPLAAYLQANAEQIAEAEPPRWKNAYNLLRLLHSGIRWLSEGEPLIAVEGETRGELLAVKRGEWPLEAVLARADALASELEAAHETTSLPEQPDYERAEAFLLACRRRAAAEDAALQRQAVAITPLTPVDAALQPTSDSDSDTNPASATDATDGHELFELPRAALRRFLARYEGTLDFVVCSVVGSHSYGFPSVDSDFDLKAIHLAPAEAMLGLDDPPATFDFLQTVEGLEIDFTSHEARPALTRLLAGDGNALERILSPYLLTPVADDARLVELRALARANLSRRFHRHYQGFLRGMEKQYERDGRRRIKPLLYMFRVALTGVHLLEAGELVADLRQLLSLYPQPSVDELLRQKTERELGTIDDDASYLALIPALHARLAQAKERSALPEEPPARDALDAWLRRWRRA